MSLRLKKRYAIVIAEKDADAAALISGLANELGGYVPEVVSSLSEAKKWVEGAFADVVLVSSSVLGPPDGSAPDEMIWDDQDPPLVLIGTGPDDAVGASDFASALSGFVPRPLQAGPLGMGIELAVSQYRRIREAARDVTCGRLVAEGLADHIRLLETLLDTIPNPVFYKNTEGVYTGCNESFARFILGLPKSSIIGHTFYDFPDQIPRALADQYYEQDQALLCRPGTQTYETKVACADGAVRDFVFNKGVYFDQNGRPAGIIGIMMDISERKRIESELKASRKQAELASRTKSEFLASMSHEIRTPLNSMLGMIDLTLQDNLLPEQLENLSMARDSARHLLHIINDVLDMSKIEAGKIELEEINFDLYALILKIVRSMGFQAEKRNIRCHHHIDDGVPQIVKGDAFRLRQVLINLISNAVKFTKQGEIEILLKRVEADEGPLSTGEQAEKSVSLLFSVRDTGQGIPAGSMDKLFHHFSQGEYSTTRKYGGTGLGLVISKYLVEMMQGRIWVESREGQGSTFYFTAVFRPGDAQEVEKKTPAPPIIPTLNPRSTLILLVEDNHINAKVATKFLDRLGYGVNLAANGREALTMLAAKHYDLVLMDVEMPGMGGLEATRRIRDGEAGKARQHVPIIAMTAHALTEFKEQCEKAGMNDYLSKPVNFYELGSVIEKNMIAADLYLPEIPASPMYLDEEPLLDKAGVLRRIGGDYGLLDYLYESFNEEIPGKIDGLREALAAEKYEKISQEAHNLKNNCGAVGAINCQHLAEELEQAAREMRSDRVRLLVDKLIKEMQMLHVSFSRKAD